MRAPSPLYVQDRRRGRSLRTVVGWLSIGVGAVAVAALLVLALLWWNAGSQLTPLDIAGLRPSVADGGTATAADAPTNVLVVAHRHSKQAGPAAASILLVQFSPQRPQPMVVSLPPRLQLAASGGQQLANVVTEQGPEEIVQAVQKITGGLAIDHFVDLDLDAAASVTDALGGVRVCIDAAVRDPASGLDLAAGCQQLRGQDATAFVTADAVDGTLGRIARQLQFMGGAAQRATALMGLANPLRDKRLLDAIGQAVVSDRDLGLIGMYRLASALGGIDASAVDLRSVPGTLQTVGGTTVVVATPDQAPAMYAALASGSELDPDVGTAAPAALAPADVKVLIVNGVGVAGLAGEVRTYLEDRDFRVVDAVNPRDLDPRDGFDTGLKRLTIRHTAATLPYAQVLQARLGDLPVDLAEVKPDELEDGADVILVVGSAWRAPS